MYRCNTCKYWNESSTYTNMGGIHRRLCSKIGKFTPADHFCSKYSQTTDVIYCQFVKQIVSVDEYCKPAKLDECKRCPYRDMFSGKISAKGLLKRNQRAAFQLQIISGGSVDMVDGRILFKKAVDALNLSDLVDEKIDSQNIPSMPISELKDVINKFFDLVESVPANKEDLLDPIIIEVYNKLVDGEIVFLNDIIEGKRIIASNGVFYFKRGA